jgi:hypothetical protein
VISYFPQDVKSFSVRQHDIQHNQLMIALDCALYPFGTGMDGKQCEALRYQVLRHQMAQVAVVVDDQKTRIGSLCHSV